MGKTKKEGKMHYEILFILPNKFTQDEADKIAESVKKDITDNSGVITYNESWGKKKLAYPIDTNNHGYYYLYEFDLEGEKLAKLEKLLTMSQDVLRHMIVKKRVVTEDEKKEEKRIAEKIAAKSLEKKEEEEKKEEKKKEEQKSDKKKVDLEELDEKLDKILDTGDLL